MHEDLAQVLIFGYPIEIVISPWEPPPGCCIHPEPPDPGVALPSTLFLLLIGAAAWRLRRG